MSKKVQLLPGDYASLPVEVKERIRSARSDEVFRHVFRAYPTVPSPYYQSAAAV